jgi:putative membrane protein
MRKFFITCLLNFISLYIASLLFTKVVVSDTSSLLWAGIFLAIINFFIRPLLIIISFPINIVTFGIFTLVINTWMVMMTDWMIKGISIPGFWLSFAVAVVVSLSNMALQGVLNEKVKK